MAMRAAVDIGGTFTDVVVYDDRSKALSVGKALSTPEDLILGIFDGLESTEIDERDVDMLVHGSTVVVNALIERKGARTALVTTKGFRDVYEIGRVNRPDAFNLNFTQHQPLIPRRLVLEVSERLGPEGEVLVALDLEEVRALAETLRVLEVEAVAVVLLHAYRNPDHEAAIGSVLRDALPEVYVTLSHEVSREYREFERTSTVAANAFVGPKVSQYLSRLSARVADSGSGAALAVMQSNGGVADVSTATSQCVQMLESGPAGGVVGTIAMCEALGLPQAIAFDMGGTTAKSAVVRDLTMPLASDYFLGGYNTGLPIRIPCIDIVEVGTGGGSIAWVDEVGGIHVGPQSSGAEPGPICYGRGGTDVTITDATVVLGHLDGGGSLVGGLDLDGEAARAGIAAIADRLEMGVEAVASGIVAIAAAEMANSVRAVTTERGLDPRDFALFAYGGNGPLHVSMVARELGIARVVVPPMPAVFSSVGMLMADLRRDVVATQIRDVTPETAAELDSEFATLENECEKALRGSSVPFDGLRFERAADMRYIGQEHTVTVNLPSTFDWSTDPQNEIKSLFDSAHAERYGHSAADEHAQIVSLRVSAIGELEKPPLVPIADGDAIPPDNARRTTRDVVFDASGQSTATPVYVRERLLAGHHIGGPAIVEEPTATTLLRPGDELLVDPTGNLLITIGATL